MILVTGASGFIGQHLVRYLSAKGKRVRALYNQHPPSAEMKQLQGVEWVQCDLLDIYDVAEVMKGIAEIYHCAARVSFHPDDHGAMLHFNTEATANVVNEAVETGVRKMVHVSSIASLGRNAITKEITEEEQWEESRYNSKYALSKHMAEMEVWRGMAEGLHAVVVNPGLVLGEGDWDTGTGRFMTIVSKEFPYYSGGVNGWVDVLDLVRVMYELMESDIEEERFIVCAGSFAYKDVFTKMALALGKKPPHIKAGSFMTGLIWRLNWLKKKLFGGEVTITKETARNAQKQSIYNNSKLFKYLPGFAYTRLEETVERMAKAFLAGKK